MADRTFSRRQFLRLTAGAAMGLTVATALPPRTVQADETPPPSLPQVSDILDDPEVQKWIATGFGPLFVAGRFLDTFGRNLAFENLPASLKLKYLRAGTEWKTWPEAQAIYKTIPAQVRAAGPDALWKFHKGQDWSHIVPRALEGPTTAKNGIWWTAGKNRSLGPNPMSAVDMADARNLVHNAAIRATIVQTAKAMGMGALAGVIIVGMLSSLEIGLQYAEGKITRQEMIEEILNRTVLAGSASFVITGLIVGLPLMFPFLIPVITPVLFILQIVGLVFLVGYSLLLVKGWWDVLNDQGLLDGFNDVVGSVENALSELDDSVYDNDLSVVGMYRPVVAQQLGKDRAWKMPVFQQIGIEEAWGWVAAKSQLVGEKATDVVSFLKRWNSDPLELNVEVTGVRQSIGRVVASEFWVVIAKSQLVGEKATGIVSSLEGWNYDTPELNVEVTEIGDSIRRVVASEFGNANSTAKAMRRSISEYRESANLKGANLPLAVS